MADPVESRRKIAGKEIVYTQTRKKLGMTQAQLAAVFQVSRSAVSLSELNKRSLKTPGNTTLAKMFLTFHELETGSQSADRTLETRLFLNDEYRKILPVMKEEEENCRTKIKS